MIIAALALGVAVGAAPARRVERCRVAVQLPVGWVVSPAKATGEGTCTFEVSPKPTLHSPGIAITVFPGTIEDADVEFDKDEHGWFTVGRQGITNRASEIQTHCCLAIVGVNEVGRYGKSGYLGMGEIRVAFIVGKGRVASLRSNVDDEEKVFERFVRSLEFR